MNDLDNSATASTPAPPPAADATEPTLISAASFFQGNGRAQNAPPVPAPGSVVEPPIIPAAQFFEKPTSAGNVANAHDMPAASTSSFAAPAAVPVPEISSEPTLNDSNVPNRTIEPVPAMTSSQVMRLAPPPDSPFSMIEDDSEPPARTWRASALPVGSSAQLQRVMAQVPVAAPQAVLEAKGLTKSFGKRQVVRGADLQVGAGEIVGLLGRNGAGKTTTFRMIMGLLHPDGGSVTYQNRDITRLPMYMRANRGIGYLAQEPSIFQRMTIEDNLLAILELQEPSRKKRMVRLEELITSLGLSTVRKSLASVCSGGERRRLEIARAMSLNPRIILFDEPFAGIDPITVTEIQGILRDLKGMGVGVLLTDHNVRETLTITDRTYIMDEGKIWMHGPPREIVANAEARARYLGQDFRLDF